MPLNSKAQGISVIWLIIAGIILFSGSAYWYYAGDIKPYLGNIDGDGKNGVACTQEAKQCPDGSYVGRIGPNCEFAECSGENSASLGQSLWNPYLVRGSESPTVEVPAGVARSIGWPAKSEDIVKIPLMELAPLQLAKLGAYFAYPAGVPVSLQQALTKNEIPPSLKFWLLLPSIDQDISKQSERDADIEKARVVSRDARRVADLKQLQLALELYFDTNGSYPKQLGPLATEFIPFIPKDPETQSQYYYFLCPNDLYHLGADLENYDNVALTNDSDKSQCGADNIKFNDRLSCKGLAGRYCYDLTR